MSVQATLDLCTIIATRPFIRIANLRAHLPGVPMAAIYDALDALAEAGAVVLSGPYVAQA